ncbi:MAG: methanogenesis marker 17 protein [Methanospirillaceae archaeon]|nr:methanogenesis marker 17 protein [Methanospirillaceae archaeon]
MSTLDYFEVESTDKVGADQYRRLASVVIGDHGLLKVIQKIHIYIDPEVPVFVAVGITRTLLAAIRVSDIGAITNQDGQVIISINEETYLAALLQVLWNRFSKDMVQQPDRFTIMMDLTNEEAEILPDMIVIDPTDTLYKDLIYSMQIICPEGFKVRKQNFLAGKFYFVASEDTLPEDIMPLVREKFALMGETI